MPVAAGYTKSVVSGNVSMLLDEFRSSGKIGNTRPRGRKHAQQIAVAISLSNARKEYRKQQARGAFPKHLRKAANPTLQIPIKSKKQLGHIFEAQKHLNAAGVTFDTGADVGKKGGNRDWELDWSLKGAKLVKDGKVISKNPVQATLDQLLPENQPNPGKSRIRVRKYKGQYLVTGTNAQGQRGQKILVKTQAKADKLASIMRDGSISVTKMLDQINALMTGKKNPAQSAEQQRDVQIAMEVKRQIQLGVWLSIGAREPIAISKGLRIKVGGRSLWYEIKLNGRDYYDIELIRATSRKRTVLWRGTDVPVENLNETLIQMLDTSNQKRARGRANPTKSPVPFDQRLETHYAVGLVEIGLKKGQFEVRTYRHRGGTTRVLRSLAISNINEAIRRAQKGSANGPNNSWGFVDGLSERTNPVKRFKSKRNPLGKFIASGAMCPDCDQPMAVPAGLNGPQVRCPHCKGISRAKSNPHSVTRSFVTVTSSGRTIVTNARTAQQASSIVRTSTGEEVVASDSLDEVADELVDRSKLTEQIKRRNPGSAIVNGLAFGLGGYVAQILGDAAREEAENRRSTAVRV